MNSLPGSASRPQVLESAHALRSSGTAGNGLLKNSCAVSKANLRR